MANRKLYTGTRYREGDENYLPPSVNGLPYRLRFYDSSTSQPKEVFSGPDDADVSLGNIVNLDLLGYGPTSGIWLDEGEYNIFTQYALIENPVLNSDWGDLWNINKVPGGDIPTSSDLLYLTSVDSMSALRALEGEALIGAAIMTGWETFNDGGQGAWIWKESSMAVDDGGAYAKPTTTSAAAPGRWHRVFLETNKYNVQQWGAVSTAGNVSGNIIACENYVSSTDRADGTIVFPAGEYNISVNDVTLDRTTIAYEIMNNASFIGTGNVTIGNPSKIEGNSFVAENLILIGSVVNNGIAKPEWWGAVGDASTENSTVFDNCWTGIGDHTVELNGAYKFNTSGYGDINQAAPNLRFIGFDSRLHAIFYSGFSLSIGNIETTHSHQVLTGSPGAFILNGSSYKLSEINQANSSILWDQYQSAVNDYELIIDETIDFSTGYNFGSDITFNIVHGGKLNLGSACHLSFESIVVNSNMTAFSRNDDASTIDFKNKLNLKHNWFGIVDEAHDEIDFAIANMIRSSCNLDFNGTEVDISEVITISTTVVTRCTISNALFHSVGDRGYVVVTGSYGHLTLDNVSIARDNNETKSLLETTVPVKIHNCELFNGKIDIGPGGFYMHNSRLYSTKVNIEGKAQILAYSHALSSNRFYNSPIALTTGTSGVIGNTVISNNEFTWSTLNAGGAFITLQSNVLAADITNLRIRGNTYDYTGYVPGTKTVYPPTESTDEYIRYSPTWDDVMVSVLDTSTNPAQGWYAMQDSVANDDGSNLKSLDIVIEDTCMTADIGTIFNRSVSFGQHPWPFPNNVSVKNTAGYFAHAVATADRATNRAVTEFKPSSAFELNGAMSRVTLTSCVVTVANVELSSYDFDYSGCAVAGVFSNSYDRDRYCWGEVRVGIDFPDSLPDPVDSSIEYDYHTNLSGTFVKVFN